MANKRMFNKNIVESDAFLDMSLSAQALYFHLGLSCDDDGFVGNPRRIQRVIGCNDDDMKILLAKNFLLSFPTGVVVIKHHRMNNNWDKYNCQRTVYLQEFEQLYIKENKAYTLDETQGLSVQSDFSLNPVFRREENRIDKKRREENNTKELVSVTKTKYGEFNNVLLTEQEHTKLCDLIGEKNTNSLIEELSDYLASSGKRYKSHYATLRNWARRKIQNYQNGKGSQVAEI